MKKLLLLLAVTFCLNISGQVGTWTPLLRQSNNENAGLMLLLTDGTVIVPTNAGGNNFGNTWQKLTPDTNGSYVNGTWSNIASMHDTRLDFASQVLKDGRVFVAGGEYGTGKQTAEIYDPVANTWSYTSSPLNCNLDTIFDANSEMLPDGRVLLAMVLSGGYKQDSTMIYDPVTNVFIKGPTCVKSHDESSWVKLADNSILFVDYAALTSERYLPSTNHFAADANLPDSLYGHFDGEIGASILLPNGQVFVLGGTGHTAYYTPSGNNSHGIWTAGPNIPQGYGTPDATASMMPNGKILCMASPVSASGNLYRSPTIYFEFDYLTNSFTQILAPIGGNTNPIPCFYTNTLNLPDGSILYTQRSSQYYIYTPVGVPLTSGKPTITTITPLSCSTFKATGTLFNGISEGSCYGDDAQMATNYPIVQLKNGNYVYYARSYNWNSTCVQRGSLPDTVTFDVPSGLASGTYSLAVIANGISSDPYTFVYNNCTNFINTISASKDGILIYPNPNNGNFVIETNLTEKQILQILDVTSKLILQQTINGKATIDASSLENGIYFVQINTSEGFYTKKIIVQH